MMDSYGCHKKLSMLGRLEKFNVILEVIPPISQVYSSLWMFLLRKLSNLYEVQLNYTFQML